MEIRKLANSIRSNTRTERISVGKQIAVKRYCLTASVRKAAQAEEQERSEHDGVIKSGPT